MAPLWLLLPRVSALQAPSSPESRGSGRPSGLLALHPPAWRPVARGGLTGDITGHLRSEIFSQEDLLKGPRTRHSLYKASACFPNTAGGAHPGHCLRMSLGTISHPVAYQQPSNSTSRRTCAWGTRRRVLECSEQCYS